MGKIYRYNNCIICGKDNPIGFNLEFTSEDGGVRARALPDKRFEGYGGILHGGIISALLDEAMVKALFVIDVVSVTMEIKVKFRKPIQVGPEIIIRGEAGEVKNKVAFARAEIILQDGTIAADGEGKFFILRGEKKELMVNDLS